MNEIILLGLILAIIFTEITEISPGGFIVPAYFALYIDDPLRIIFTIIVSVVSVFIVKFVGRYTIIYGRRKFAVYIVVGVFLKFLLNFFYLGGALTFSSFSLTVGYLVPGILGKDIEKQGIVKTIIALFIVVLLTRIIYIILV